MDIFLACLDCGHQAPYSPTSNSCPRCNGTWREARYEYEKIGKTLQALLQGRGFDLWRYRELLPVRNPHLVSSMGEGGTPLIQASNLGMMLGCPNIFIKDERQAPTSSFKDRQAAVGVAALKEAGVTEVVIASTGNVAISYSAYCARAGIKLWAFLTSLVPAEKMREVAIYGTQVIKVTASYDQVKQVAAEFARQRGIYMERGARTIPSVEGMKTVAYEISEQLTTTFGAQRNYSNNGGGKSPGWQVPDWYVQSVSGGLGPLGVQKGFMEMREMGWIDRIPAMASIQAEGCAPMVHAFREGKEVAEPVRNPRTHIATLATGDPGRTYTLLYQRMREGAGGVFESVTDEETYRTMHILAKMEGISVEPAAAVAFAGVIKLVRAGKIKPNDTVVINCTGHTMPIETTILGEGWARSVALPSHITSQSTPEEGLLAALNRVTDDRFSSVAIVDDNEDARRLIRRILQAQGNYKLFEASNGKDAIELALCEVPDLIILDLMMPEFDGFAVLDALKADPKTAHIPIIVVTAKELTKEEKTHLHGQIFSLMQKGEFMSDELMDDVNELLK
ncbi:MAG: pyridoxal-phosphate dependent enzyme [Chloroflexi bacterium]|nr:MAG: pyridoxal-phosphate dependent enzyme [Chloroflexota bacterium]